LEPRLDFSKNTHLQRREASAPVTERGRGRGAEHAAGEPEHSKERKSTQNVLKDEESKSEKIHFFIVECEETK
jgi:hypothetical protein